MVMVALSCGRSPAGAEDIVQKALMKAMSIATRDPRALDKVRDPCRWLGEITRNVERDSRRKRQSRTRIQSENAEEIREAVFGVGDSDWDVQLLAEWVRDVAKTVLPPRQRDIVNRMLNGMTDEQIAKEVSVSKATVRWHRQQRNHPAGGLEKHGLDVRLEFRCPGGCPARWARQRTRPQLSATTAGLVSRDNRPLAGLVRFATEIQARVTRSPSFTVLVSGLAFSCNQPHAGIPSPPFEEVFELAEVVELGEHPADSVAEIGIFRELRNGGFAISDDLQPRVRTYSADGSLLAAFGRFGSGPWEFRKIEGLVEMPSGQIVVVSPRNQWLTYLKGDLSPDTMLPIDYIASDLLALGQSIVFSGYGPLTGETLSVGDVAGQSGLFHRLVDGQVMWSRWKPPAFDKPSPLTAPVQSVFGQPCSCVLGCRPPSPPLPLQPD